MDRIVFREMEKKELRECAHIAAQAFMSYTYFSNYIPDDKKREAFLERLILCEFKANYGLKETVILTAVRDGKPVAVAHLCSPSFEKPSDLRYVLKGWLGVLNAGGSKDVNAWNEMQKEAGDPCHRLGGKTWYLSLLTVAQQEERKGIGSAFIGQFIIPYVKEHGGEALCLFTNSEENRKFYTRNGFKEFDSRSFDYKRKSVGSWSLVIPVK